MGGKTKTNDSGTQTSNRTYTDTPTGLEPYTTAFQGGYNNLQQTFNDRISQPLNLKEIPGFTKGFDPVVQSQISKGIANIKGQQGANDRSLADTLSQAGTGDNTSLLGALRGQSAIASLGAQNALYPGAQEQQRNYDIANQNAANQANQTTLAARAQGIQELAPGMDLLGLLNQMANTAKGRTYTDNQTGTSTGNTTTKKSFF